MFVYKVTLPQQKFEDKELKKSASLEEVHADFVEEVLHNFGNCSATARAIFVVEEIEGGEDEEQNVEVADIIEYRINVADESSTDIIKEITKRYANLCGNDHVALDMTTKQSVEIS